MSYPQSKIQNPKSKIAFVVPGFAADKDDWCIPALTNLVRALAARPDVELHVYTLRYPQRVGTYRLHGATVHAFGGAPFGRRRVWGVSLGRLWTAFAATLRADHHRAPFALMHGFWATESGALAALVGRALHIPTLVHLAGGELAYDRATGYGNRQPGLSRLLVAAALHAASALTVPSSPMRAGLHRTYPQYARKAHDWAFGVDLALFHPPPAPPPASPVLRLIHAASLLPVKDQTLLLDGLAAARAAAPAREITLTVAGTGPEAAALRAHAARLGLADVVTWLGEVRHEMLPALYRAHDAFVLTSRHEAQCLALLEAAACGLPWISTPVGAAVDLARAPLPSGWLVPPHNPDALGRAILAATNAEERTRRGQAAADQVAQAYSLERQVDRLLGLYERLGAC